jgi:hypothetical protein
MNTIAEFCEWMMETEQQQQIDATSVHGKDMLHHRLPKHNGENIHPYSIQCITDEGMDEEEPSLTDTEDASLIGDDLSSYGSSDNLLVTESHHDGTARGKRRIRFHGTVKVREYAVTIGQHDCCDGPLPLTLDWMFVDGTDRNIEGSKHRQSSFDCPPRLSVAQRRQRLQAVAGYSVDMLDRIVHAPPLSLAAASALGKVVEMLWIKLVPATPKFETADENDQQSWQTISLMDDEEEDEEPFEPPAETEQCDFCFEEPASPPQMIHWVQHGGNNNKSRSVRRMDSFNV